MNLPTLRGALGAALMLLLPCSHANQGGISLNQTRVIFSAENKAQSIAITNSGSRAWLIQSQITSGDHEPVRSHVPFIATPPLFTLKGDSRQLLRILPQANTLPADRESLFYLNVTAIPAHAEPVADQGRLSVGLRFKLKLFYRPAGFDVTPDEAACRLAFTREGQGVSIHNPTPYFQTLGALSFDGKAMDITQQPSMVAPHGRLALKSQGQTRQVSWHTLTDYGGLSARCQQIL